MIYCFPGSARSMVPRKSFEGNTSCQLEVISQSLKAIIHVYLLHHTGLFQPFCTTQAQPLRQSRDTLWGGGGDNNSITTKK